MWKKMKKTTKSNMITFGMVILAYAVIQAMVMTGNISSLFKGLYRYVHMLSWQFP